MAENKTLQQKLLEVQKQVSYLQKSTPGKQYNYVSSSQTLQAVRSLMDAEGLLLAIAITNSRLHFEVAYKDPAGKKQAQHLTELDLEMTWVNADNPEDVAVYPWYGQGIDSGEKGVGKALTYAEKYFLLKYFHIATDKDDPDQFQEETNGRAAPSGEITRKRQVKPEAPGTWGEGKANSFRKAAMREGVSEEEYLERLRYYGVARLEDLPETALGPMQKWLKGIAGEVSPRAVYETLAEQLGWSPAQTDGTWDGLTVNGEIDGPALDEQLGKMKAELQDTGGAAGV